MNILLAIVVVFGGTAVMWYLRDRIVGSITKADELVAAVTFAPKELPLASSGKEDKEDVPQESHYGERFFG
jgi:hypothetical protein